MFEVKDCNGVPLKVGDKCMIVKSTDFCKPLIGKIVVVLGLYPETDHEYPGIYHEEIRIGDTGHFCRETDGDWVMKLQDLDDDEILENNILFSTTSDNWERITDYPAKPKLEPELEPSTV